MEWTEDAQYKLGGLLLMIEGVGRNKSDDKVIRQALGFVSYDDLARTYRMHAYNDGRYLESELKLVEKGEGFTWGFSLGEIRTSSALRINENGAWTETHDITIGSQPSRRFMELTVIPKK